MTPEQIAEMKAFLVEVKATILAQAADLVAAWLAANPVGVTVKPLKWHNYDAWTWWAESTSGTYRVQERNGFWRATLNLPQTEHIIYEYETDGAPNDFEAAHIACQDDHNRRILAALSSTPVDASEPAETAAKTPTLDALAMQRAAINVVSTFCLLFRGIGYAAFADRVSELVPPIAAIPLPPGAALAEALRLPEIAAVVEAAQYARNRLEMIADESWNGDGRDLKRLVAGVFSEFSAALAALGEQP